MIIVADSSALVALSTCNALELLTQLCVGALGVLLLAKHHDLIDQIAPFVEILRSSTLHYSTDLLEKMLQLAGE